MPAFHRRKKAAAIVARLLAGYGELELGLAKCVGMALAYRRNPPKEVPERYNHRINYENFAIKLIFRTKKNRSAAHLRIKNAGRIMRKPYRSVKLETELDQAINALIACLRIRNTFAHCHWDQSRKRGLFFIDLEEVALLPARLDLSNIRHASIKTLEQIESYYLYTAELLAYLADEFAVKTELVRYHGTSKPKGRPVLSENHLLFPHKSPR
jgi:hypothetical protein